MLLKDLISGVDRAYENIDISGITSDSRAVREGFAFVCVVGAVSDGHSYAKSAAGNGAAVIIAEHDVGLENQIIVEDTHSIYAQMCANWFGRPADSLELIGVTGTNGKTSVTYMLKSVLEQSGIKAGLIGTIQNIAGDEIQSAKNTTPGIYELHELFAKMKAAGCTHVVMEVSSHALEQRRVEGLHFRLALFTNLTQDHLDYHKTMKNYMFAKRKLFERCDTAIVNFDDQYANELLDGIECEKVTYSAESDSATYTAKNIRYRGDGIEYEFVGFDAITRIHLSTGGKFTVYNSLCAAAAAVKLGCSLNFVSAGLAKLSGVRGRAEVVPTGKNFTVIIDYAHTPDGLQNILSAFRECKRGRLISLFGCGGDRDKTKRPLMGKICAALSDFVIVTSDNPRTEKPEEIIKDILAGMKNTKTPYVVIENRIEAIKYAIKNAEAGDIVILAGKGHETYQILDTERVHFDEREVVAEALKECLNG